MRQEFDIVAPDLRLITYPVLVFFWCLCTMGVKEPRLWWALIPIMLLFGFASWWILRRDVSLDSDTGELRVLAGVSRASIRMVDVDVEAARIVNLANESSLRPSSRVFGISVPGYDAGQFRLHDGSSALLVLSDHTRVLALPERSGRVLLLSLEKPQALINALHEIASATTRK